MAENPEKINIEIVEDEEVPKVDEAHKEEVKEDL